MNSRHVYLVLFAATLAVLVSVVACNQGRQPVIAARPSHIPSPSPTPSPKPNDTVDHFVVSTSELLYDWERGALTRAWNKVPHHSAYELVQSVHGEVAGAYGMAMIVLDKSLPGSNQGGLIVFIQHAHNKFDLYWIFKNENLSRVSISRLSGGIIVEGLREDGSPVNCRIAWSRKDNQWTCIGF